MDRSIAIIGGGPAGASLATYLARGGKSVTVFEKSNFPRFHIGESLLPATMPLLKELGVYDQMRSTFLNKPGGAWYYDRIPILGNFANCDETASFKDYGHALMVERSKFDRMLLDNAKEQGVDVFQGHAVRDLIWQGDRLIGLKVRDLKTQEEWPIRTEMVFDCSGYQSIIASQLNLRKPNRLKRMAVFAHYQAEVLEERLKENWFVGQMLYEGWLWLIPIDKNRISIGVVTTLANYKEAQVSPEKFLESCIQTAYLTDRALGKDLKRVSEVHLYGNLGYSSARIFGDGWALVGDAALFIDPCYSTGVHLAMESAKNISQLYLECGHDAQALQGALIGYERKLRQHEKLVLMLVDSFYMASRNQLIRSGIVRLMMIPAINQKFLSFIGGDFDRDTAVIKILYYLHCFFSKLTAIFQQPYQRLH